jgi:hypothetical protein
VSSKSSVISRVAKLQNNSPTSVAKMNLARIPKPKEIYTTSGFFTSMTGEGRSHLGGHRAPERIVRCPDPHYNPALLKRYEDIELAQKPSLPKIPALAPLRIVENSLALKCAWIASKRTVCGQPACPIRANISRAAAESRHRLFQLGKRSSKASCENE